jgi:hypothetical protein
MSEPATFQDLRASQLERETGQDAAKRAAAELDAAKRAAAVAAMMALIPG